ncbi:xanthine dehydrogenase family protein molybdopterin-binding subunit [Chitinophagaceae bacterium MMS25-I14]
MEKKSEPINRVDGYAKVTGKARYFAEFTAPQMTYAVVVPAGIARGIITTLNTRDAENAPGVVRVFTHLNMPKIPGWEQQSGGNDKQPQHKSIGGSHYKILGSPEILFDGQPVAIVVADTLERAQYAASLVQAQYKEDKPQTDLSANKEKAAAPPRGGDYKRGDESAWKNAPVTLEEDYMIPVEVHNPMELHGIMAVWDGDDKVTVYAKTQGVKATQQSLMHAFNLEEKNVQVHSEFVGGAFGMALRTWPHETAIVAIAKAVKRPVKLVLSRDQMFTLVGYRPHTLQKFFMGATKEGKLVGMQHEAVAETASYEDFTESTVNMTHFMYDCPNVVTKYRLVALDRGVPIWMRGPGEATGAFALECAMDEMAYKLNLDPIEFRLRNYAETDPEANKPFSSKYVKEAYQTGADKIGWFKRNPAPRSMQEDGWLVGYGMSTGTFGAHRGTARSKAILSADGSLVLQSAAADIGPGTATTMVQIAHESLGIPREKIRFELGNSSLPQAPMQGGSSTVSTVGSAVYDVCAELKKSLFTLLNNDNRFKDVKPEDLVFENGNISNKSGAKVAIADLLKKENKPAMEATVESKGGAEMQQYSMYSFSIHFAEVRVHPATGVVRVHRVVTVADSGRIVSPKTAASQMIGGVTGGIGMALTEEAILDHRFGKYVNNNLADYHVPVSADVPHIETLFIDKPDPHTNPMGSKGMGEIALIGFAASVANAVYHATGRRIRTLPITPDKLI